MPSPFPIPHTCEHCGALTARSVRGYVKGHSRAALAAGRVDAECVRDTEAGQAWLAAHYRESSATRAARARWVELCSARERVWVVTEGTAQRKVINS